MRPGTIEVINVGLHRALQMTLTENQDMVKAFSTDTAQVTLTHGVGFRCLRRCAKQLDVAAGGDLLKTDIVFVIMVEDEESWCLAKGGGFSQLLGNPGISWMPGDTHMDDTSRA